MPQVIADEGRDEIVAMVVARLAAQLHRQAALGTGRLESLGLQLLLQKCIIEALVEKSVIKDVHFTKLLLGERHGTMALLKAVGKPVARFGAHVAAPDFPFNELTGQDWDYLWY